VYDTSVTKKKEDVASARNTKKKKEETLSMQSESRELISIASQLGGGRERKDFLIEVVRREKKKRSLA